MKQYSTLPNHRSRSRRCQYALGILLLCLSVNLAATELDMVLAEQEQQLLHIAEQQRQLQILNNLLPPLQQLANYPQAAVELLIDNNPLGRLSMDDRQLLKQVINALRTASPDMAEASPTTAPEPASVNPTLKPVLVLLNDQSQASSGQVVFQPADGQPPIVTSPGVAFQHQGGNYRLLAIQATSHKGPVEQFAIRMQTPQGIKTYLLPESL